MADPISAAGLILAIGQVTACLIDYGKAVADASNDVATVSQELFSLRGALEYLQTDADDRTQAGLSPFQVMPSFDEQKYFDMVTMTHSFLQSLLKDLEEPKKRFARWMKRLEWSLKRADVDKHFTRLACAKTWFVLVLMTESSGLIRENHAGVETLCETLNADLRESRTDKIAQENAAFLSRMSPVNPTASHERVAQGRRYHAVQWFMQGALSEFLASPDNRSSIIVLQGKSGSGKSTLW